MRCTATLVTIVARDGGRGMVIEPRVPRQADADHASASLNPAHVTAGVCVRAAAECGGTLLQMTSDNDLWRSVEEARRELREMTPEASLAVARMVRDAKPRLRTDRQRELAEESAQRFEARAAAHAPQSPPV